MRKSIAKFIFYLRYKIAELVIGNPIDPHGIILPIEQTTCMRLFDQGWVPQRKKQKNFDDELEDLYKELRKATDYLEYTEKNK